MGETRDFAIDEEFDYGGGRMWIAWEGAAGVQLQLQRDTTSVWVPVMDCSGAVTSFDGDGATIIDAPSGRLRFSGGTWTAGGAKAR